MRKRVLITGGAGYIGSLLSTRLVDKGYKVTVIDTLEFDKNSLSHLFAKKNFIFIKGDVRNKNLISKLLKSEDIIIPLAALVGAPLCDRFPKKTKEINFEAINYILSKLKKNQKLIYPNTNSGYGIGKKNSYCDENSPLKPISLYGKTKVEAENNILKHKNSVVFRLATVFGHSYRMRTDLLVNFLVREAVLNKKIEIFEPNFRRNYIHVEDVVNAFIFTIQNFKKMRGNIYNLGLSNANLTKIQLANLVKSIVKKVKIKILRHRSDPDKRDYFVSNRKIEKCGFKPKFSLESGIKELSMIYEINDFKDNKNNY
tara:strand:+ start:7177 stop:8118 length:942 start_codon:yes stop_codon:yes gene_type:complete